MQIVVVDLKSFLGGMLNAQCPLLFISIRFYLVASNDKTDVGAQHLFQLLHPALHLLGQSAL